MTTSEIPMRRLPASERPYERMESLGAGALSDAELLAILIRTGRQGESAVSLSRRVLSLDRASRGAAFLHDLSLAELRDLPGIGRVKAIQVKAALELGRRAMRPPAARDRPLLSSPDQVAALYMDDLRILQTEEIHAVLLDRRNRILCRQRLAEGGLTAAALHPRDLFRSAVKANAAAMILLHNHPSGDPTPSEEDIRTTGRLRAAADMMGIPLLDHLVIGGDSYVSLRQRNLL